MKLDTSHLDQFENIAPPLRHALTLPVETDKPLAGVVVYVAGSAFDHRTTRQDVLDVAVKLRLLTPELHNALHRAYDILMNTPGAHQDVCDALANLMDGRQS